MLSLDLLSTLLSEKRLQHHNSIIVILNVPNRIQNISNKNVSQLVGGEPVSGHHTQRTVEPYHLSVDHRVLYDGLHKLRKLVRVAEPLRKGHRVR